MLCNTLGHSTPLCGMDFDIWDECHLMWDEIQVLTLKILQHCRNVGS